MTETKSKGPHPRTVAEIPQATVDAYRREILDQIVLVRLDTARKAMDISADTMRRIISDGQINVYDRNARRLPEGIRLSQSARILASDLRKYVRSMLVDVG